MYSKELIKGTLRTVILKMLKEHGRMYGYEITQKVRTITDDELVITEGALYPALHKLEADKLVSTEKEYIGKRVRRYYSLTPAGEQEVSEKVEEFQSFVDMMQLVLKPKSTFNA
ncbi:MAG: PadR family transcriptional regulator [Bacteroidetes bacterium]|nr:PadR family transcriptional regulator [Bacteroidota bacterium]